MGEGRTRLPGLETSSGRGERREPRLSTSPAGARLRSGHPRAHSADEDAKGLEPVHNACGTAVLPACQEEPWQGWSLALGRGQGLLTSRDPGPGGR